MHARAAENEGRGSWTTRYDFFRNVTP